VVDEVAAEGWQQSPLLACFHPSVQQVFKESVQLQRNVQALRDAWRPRDASRPDVAPLAEPTLEQIRSEHRPDPAKPHDEVTDPVGLCLWDVFSDNHEVIAADGRSVDIGSFRGASAFLDEHLTGGQDSGREGDYMRFYLGTVWIARRADLTPFYAMIFRRLRSLGADWVYHFPELYVTELAASEPGTAQSTSYSVSQSAAAELSAQQRQAGSTRLCAQIEKMNASAREEAMDEQPPATVRAYRQVYGRDPRGWPPA